MQETIDRECSWLEHGHTERELLEWGRQMIQERTLPYMGDWEVTDEILDGMHIPMKRILN